MSELSGKKLAVIKAVHFDPALLKAFISFYGLRESDLVELTLPEVGRAMKAKRVIGALVFGPIGAGTISDALAVVRKSFKEKPSYLASRRPRRSPPGGRPTRRSRSSRELSVAHRPNPPRRSIHSQ